VKLWASDDNLNFFKNGWTPGHNVQYLSISLMKALYSNNLYSGEIRFRCLGWSRSYPRNHFRYGTFASINIYSKHEFCSIFSMTSEHWRPAGKMDSWPLSGNTSQVKSWKKRGILCKWHKAFGWIVQFSFLMSNFTRDGFFSRNVAKKISAMRCLLLMHL
jgi:hypothetical protein